MSNTNVGLETWERIPGFEDLYEVSDLGRVRTLATGVIKKRSTKEDGQVNVSLNGALTGTRNRSVQVKLIVLAAFVGPRPEGMVTVNLDGDRDNCALSNLAYLTLGEARIIADRTRGRQPRLNKRMFAELQAEALSSGASVVDRAGLRGIKETTLRNYVKRLVMYRAKEKEKTESKGLGSNFVGH
jgi:hypothetical protein